MTSISEWVPIPTARRRLWSLAKANRFDIDIGLPLRQLIDDLVTAHVKNYYDSTPRTDSEGVEIIEWAPFLGHVRRVRPDTWPPEPVELPALENQHRRGPRKGKVDRYSDEDRMLFTEMKQLIALPQYGSVRAAALHLAAEGKIAGPSTVTEATKADRLARRYRAATR